MDNEVENFYLCWGGFQRNLKSTFSDLATEQYFTDVTLVCEGEKQIAAHKIVLSASSPFFKQILIKNPHQHPLIYLKGVRYRDLFSIIRFIYFGEVKIRESDLQNFLKLSEELEVKGVSGIFIQPEVPVTEDDIHEIQLNVDALDLNYETDLDKAVFIDEKDELSESVFKKDLEENHTRPKYSVSSSVYSELDDDHLLQDSPAHHQNQETKETLKENPRDAKYSVSSSNHCEVGEELVDRDTSAHNDDVDNIDGKYIKRKSLSLNFFSRSRSKERRRKRDKSCTKLNMKKLNSSDNLSDVKSVKQDDDSMCGNMLGGVNYKCLNCDTKCLTKEDLHRHMELKDHY